jgi:hypothetical protein
MRPQLFPTGPAHENFDKYATSDTHRENWSKYRVKIWQMEPVLHGTPIPTTSGFFCPSYAALRDFIRPYWDGNKATFQYRVSDFHLNRWVTSARVFFEEDEVRKAEVAEAKKAGAGAGPAAEASASKPGAPAGNTDMKRIGLWARAFVDAASADPGHWQAFCRLLELADADGMSPAALLVLVKDAMPRDA